ncbi:MAG: lipopolysaccharide heptosyltransferase II [Chthoniobacterales bacterium]
MDYALYLTVLALLAVLERLPLGVVFRLGTALGLLAWALLPGYRRLARRNVEIAFGGRLTPREIRRIVRRHFARLGANLLSAPRLARMPEADVQARVEMTGLSHLREALARGHGVVLAINHIGNWELYAQLIGHIREYPVGVVFQSQRNQYLNRLIDRNRRRLGMETFDRRDGYVGAAGMIERGGVLAILIDQHAGETGVWTPLFGKLASTSPLAATLASRTGAPLISVAIHTTGTARWHCVIDPPLAPDDRTVPELTWMLNRTLEKEIAASPPDWFWLHNRWKVPRPRFLAGRRVKRGFYLPPGTTAADLDPFRLLIRSSNWLGDAVMSIPAVEACKMGRPDLHLTVLTPAKLAPLWRRVAAVDEVLVIKPGENPWQLARRLRRRFDAALLFPNSLRSALEARALGVPRLVGYPGHHRQWLLGQMPKFTPESGGHHAHRYLRLVVHCGAPESEEPPTFKRRPHHRAGRLPRLGVCPGAEYGPAKRWPAERFAAALREFHASSPAEWVLFGVAGDAPAGQEIVRNCPFPVRNRIGQTTLDELMDELATCDALLTNDTGTMHLAAFLGVPTVAIFGSTEPDLTAPLGDFHEVLRHKVDCSPCFLRECPIDFRCMTGIEPAAAAAALHRVLNAPTS